MSFLTLLSLLLSFCSCHGATYAWGTQKHNHSSQYSWKEVVVDVLNFTQHKLLLPMPNTWSYPARQMVQQPVFVSMATVSFRVQRVHQAIHALLHGVVVPDRIFLFMSDHPFMMDQGIVALPARLLALVAEGLLTIVFTGNIGPHRKLLPLLHRYYTTDVLIATVDDDLPYSTGSTVLYRLLHGYALSGGKAITALRVRRIGFCDAYPHKLIKYTLWSLPAPAQPKLEMLVVPTGTGGVLYHPSFLHPIVFDPTLRELTASTDDLAFRLASMMQDVQVMIECRDLLVNGQVVRRCPVDHAALDAGLLPTLPALADIQPADTQRQLKAQQSLWQTNRNGVNERQWLQATAFLYTEGLFDFSRLVARFYLERERECYADITDVLWRADALLAGRGGGGSGSGAEEQVNKMRAGKFCSIMTCEAEHGKRMMGNIAGGTV